MLGNNLIALVVTLALMLLWLRLMDVLAHRGVISSPISRKIIHIGTGPFFVLCWLLFTDQASSRYLAALVPFGITAQFFLVGIGVIKDEAAVAAMARHGDRREILRGPLFYGIVFVILTLIYWLENPIGIVALMILCGGDGLADIVGKKIKSRPLPWSPRKTLAGTLTVFLGGLLFSVVILALFQTAGVFNFQWNRLILILVLISLGCAVVESLPLRDIDNLTVPLTAVILGTLLF